MNISFMPHPPQEMPSSEHRLTQCLGRVVPHEVHIPPYLQAILLRHSLLREMPILGKVLAKVASIQYLRRISTCFSSLAAFCKSPQTVPKPHPVAVVFEVAPPHPQWNHRKPRWFPDSNSNDKNLHHSDGIKSVTLEIALAKQHGSRNGMTLQFRTKHYAKLAITRLKSLFWHNWWIKNCY